MSWILVLISNSQVILKYLFFLDLSAASLDLNVAGREGPGDAFRWQQDEGVDVEEDGRSGEDEEGRRHRQTGLITQLIGQNRIDIQMS